MQRAYFFPEPCSFHLSCLPARRFFLQLLTQSCVSPLHLAGFFLVTFRVRFGFFQALVKVGRLTAEVIHLRCQTKKNN